MQGIKLVVLDRDGVINQDSDDYIKTPEEWIPIPGSLEAIARLNHTGYRVIVATNQSGLGRGYFSIDTINTIHRKMRRELSVFGAQIEAIFLCPHTPNINCRCRKPLPGLLEDIAKRLRINMAGVPMIGDSFRDIQAAAAVGASPLLVLTGKGQATVEEHMDDLTGIPIHKDLSTAVDALLAG
ncbi:D-glycero-beta-D-manno-heptose 1,7-bisphosphate 7-phosphatase [Candidatus Thiosymbion oneisti]|uniref:D-glycero-beta-D-manno-heptose 1,7-bisphosphate 7-phosphatase n=1 Tax=Candidatus Thiosymbion oneisti TaxID=589554 RepID=UPI000A6D28F4|nr:D-glycero-beta-D-manno-heptose 1,7-bisphosphate 7-phosphatase [Candidatus Thiosymbion oneisti]